MYFLQLLQTEVPGWVGPTMAISLAIVALSFLAIAGVVLVTARAASRQIKDVGEVVRQLRGDLSPALQSFREIVEEGREIAGEVTDEAHAIVRSSRQFREGFGDRLANMEALYDVLEEEVQETALTVASTLRTFRSRADWFSRLRALARRGGR